ERRRERYNALRLRLQAARLSYAGAKRHQIVRARDRIAGVRERARVAFAALLQNRLARVEQGEGLLSAVSDRGVLAQCFALVRGLDGKPLRMAADVRMGQHIDIEFGDGNVRAVAEGSARGAQPSVAMPAPPAKPRRRAGSGGEGQGSLFGA